MDAATFSAPGFPVPTSTTSPTARSRIVSDPESFSFLWSSLDGHGNAIGVARSETARIAGRWLQQLQPLLSRDGGPGMIARTLAGQLLLGQHHPNEIAHERAVFYPIEQTSKSIRFIGQHPG